WHDGLLRNNDGVLEFYTGGTWKAVGGVKNVQRGRTQVTLPNPGGSVATASVNVTISSVNLSKSHITLGTTRSGHDSAYIYVEARLTSPTTLNVFASGLPTRTYDVPWEVVEFN